MPRLKGYQFSCAIVAYAVRAYHRFGLSAADVEDLLAERGIIVSRESSRKWVNRFGRHFAGCIKPDRPAAADKWHLDEVVIPVNGVKMWVWRAVDANGDVPDILVQPRRNAKAARRFPRRLITRGAQPCFFSVTYTEDVLPPPCFVSFEPVHPEQNLPDQQPSGASAFYRQ